MLTPAKLARARRELASWAWTSRGGGVHLDADMHSLLTPEMAKALSGLLAAAERQAQGKTANRLVGHPEDSWWVGPLGEVVELILSGQGRRR